MKSEEISQALKSAEIKVLHISTESVLLPYDIIAQWTAPRHPAYVLMRSSSYKDVLLHIEADEVAELRKGSHRDHALADAFEFLLQEGYSYLRLSAPDAAGINDGIEKAFLSYLAQKRAHVFVYTWVVTCSTDDGDVVLHFADAHMLHIHCSRNLGIQSVAPEVRRLRVALFGWIEPTPAPGTAEWKRYLDQLVAECERDGQRWTIERVRVAGIPSDE